MKTFLIIVGAIFFVLNFLGSRYLYNIKPSLKGLLFLMLNVPATLFIGIFIYTVFGCWKLIKENRYLGSDSEKRVIELEKRKDFKIFCTIFSIICHYIFFFQL